MNSQPHTDTYVAQRYYAVLAKLDLYDLVNPLLIFVDDGSGIIPWTVDA